MAGLFDALGLTGSPAAEQSAAATRAQLQAYQDQVNNIYGTYQTGSLGALGEARTAGLGALSGGMTSALGSYGQGIEAAKAGVGGYDTLKNLGSSYQPAIDAYYAALGLKGPEAAAASRANFLPGTGYQFQQDEAARQALAQASKLGIAQSGNTANTLIQRAGDLAGSQWQDYLNRLQGFVSPQLQALTGYATGNAQANLGLAGIYGTQAGAQTQYGQNVAGLEQGYGQDTTNVLGNVAAQTGQSARDVVQGNIAANNQIANAAQQDAMNRWGAINAGIGAVGSAFRGPGTTYTSK